MAKSNLEKAMSFEELWTASYQCRKGVRNKFRTLQFRNKNLKSLYELHEELTSGKYKLSKYNTFKIYEPKERLIEATKFKDRVFQRSLCNNGLFKELTKGFIYDNGACLKGKGTNFTLDRVKRFLNQYYNREKTNEGYALHLDVRKYFPSTPKSVTKEMLKKSVSEEFLPYLYEIVDSFADVRPEEEIAQDPFGRRGIGLGSQISQLLQLRLLSPLDHYIKEVLKIKYYIRYMDDLLLIDRDKEKLLKTRDIIEGKLNEIGLCLKHMEGTQKLKKGFKFLKIHFMLTDKGRVVSEPIRENITKERRKLRKLKKLFENNEISKEDIVNHFSSWLGNATKSNSKKYFREMNIYFGELFFKDDKPIENQKESENVEFFKFLKERIKFFFKKKSSNK